MLLGLRQKPAGGHLKHIERLIDKARNEGDTTCVEATKELNALVDVFNSHTDATPDCVLSFDITL